MYSLQMEVSNDRVVGFDGLSEPDAGGFGFDSFCGCALLG